MLECMLEHAVLATEQLGLDNTILKGPVQPFTHHSSLITFIETVKHIIVIVFFKLNLVISFQHPGDQPARLAGHDHMITVAPRLLGQSSSTPVAPRRPTGTKQADGSHAGCVAGTEKARMF